MDDRRVRPSVQWQWGTGKVKANKREAAAGGAAVRSSVHAGRGRDGGSDDADVDGREEVFLAGVVQTRMGEKGLRCGLCVVVLICWGLNWRVLDVSLHC